MRHVRDPPPPPRPRRLIHHQQRGPHRHPIHTAFEPTLTTAYRRTTVLLPASAHNTVDSRMTIDAETSGGTVIVNGSETGTATETSGAAAGGMGGFGGRP